MSDKIIGVAAKHPDGNVYSLLAPSRHGAILRLVAACYPDDPDAAHKVEQGFITASGSFVRRSTAKVIAYEAGQLITANTSRDLFSEDVW